MMGVLSGRSLRETVERVRERLAPGSDQLRRPFVPPAVETHYAEVTSTTQTDGRYPGTLYQRDGSDATFTQIGDTGGIWIDTPNGELLFSSGARKFPVRITGTRAADGKEVFEILGIPFPFLRGKLDGALSSGGSATLSVWWFNGSAEADTGDNITVHDNLGGGDSGDWAYASWDALSARYYATATTCP